MTGTALHNAFHHEAFLYAGDEGFLRGAVPFIRAGLEGDEPVLVVVAEHKIGHLRDALGSDAAGVSFADMAEVGRNPARIIPTWRDFLADHRPGRPARGIGEPVHAERSPDELLECQRHEALLNVAFARGAAWQLLCPYDTSTLAPDVIAASRHSHRYVTAGPDHQVNTDYRGDTWAGPGEDRLPDPPADALPLAFGPGPLHGVRRFVTDRVAGTLEAAALSDLLLAVTEAASNSIVHGGGAGALRVWYSANAVVCEVRDEGWIRQPLAGRTRPSLDREHGRGLWMINQLCDLVQLRSSPAGTVVRLHMLRRAELHRV